MLLDGGEIALLDVREEGDFGDCHILLSVNVPLSRLELQVASLVPRTSARVVVCDARDEGLAQRGAARLEYHGYTRVDVLSGGTAAWEAAGHEVFSGMNVPSKLFGEFIEHHYGTPSVSASELKSMLDGDEDVVVLDSRPMSEFREMNIPGSTCVPGAELVYRVREVVTDPNTTIVVNCAGRTRSIIGAQSLINAGITNKVVALRNGTMGWHLAGFALEHGQDRHIDTVESGNLEKAKHAAARVADRFDVTFVDRVTLDTWRRSGERSVYVLDVRSPEEFQAGHLPGSLNAPGGQLVQATDRYVATLRSKIVLVDDNTVRAVMTASWINQLGLHDAVVLDRGLLDATLLRGTQPYNALGLDDLNVETIDALSLSQHIREGTTAVIDVERSLAFRRGHIPGAVHAVRGHLHERMDALPAHDCLALTSSDGMLAQYCVAEASQLSDADVVALEGGNNAWTDAGLALEQGSEGLEDSPNDAFLRPYDNDRSVEEAMQSYLDWEIALLDKMDTDGTVAFRTA